jgi:hypothetical protein
VIPLGLSTTQLADLHSTLTSNRSLQITVQPLTLNGTRLPDISWRLLDGQVNVDYSAPVTRQCTLSLLDPNRTMDFDSDSPNDGAMYLDRMVQVNYSVRKPGGTQYTIPLFTGPVTKLNRNNDVVNIEAEGKESLAMGAAWTPATYRKGALKTDVIRSVLATRGGENKFTFEDSTSKLPTDYSIGRGNTPWGVAKHVANGMGMQLFYDGRGTARLRRFPQGSLYVFTQGDGGSVRSTPQVSYSSENLRNVIWVKGGVPAGAKKPIEVTLGAPSSHPLSASKLGRNGVPRYLMETIEESSIMSQSEALKVAKVALDKALLQAVEVAFDSVPIPHLDPYDMVRVTTEDFSAAFYLSKFTIPLKVGSPMSVGYLKNVAVKGRRVR